MATRPEDRHESMTELLFELISRKPWIRQQLGIGEDTHVLQALFACIMSTAGGLLEMAIWLRWPLFK